MLFAYIWPYFRQRGFEATLVGLFYAAVIWIVMHVAIAIASSNHPNYLDANVIIGGFMSHFLYAVPLALITKHRLGPNRSLDLGVAHMPKFVTVGESNHADTQARAEVFRGHWLWRGAAHGRLRA
ncbi:MAG: hypothetical protein JO110_22860 [Acetobacteraceae bacterium]|nr:hypothetical protein [Acetobacteraceae bacterium]